MGSRLADWLRYFAACRSPESRLGALRGAQRDGVLDKVLTRLRIRTAAELVDALHLEIEAIGPACSRPS